MKTKADAADAMVLNKVRDLVFIGLSRLTVDEQVVLIVAMVATMPNELFAKSMVVRFPKESEKVIENMRSMKRSAQAVKNLFGIA